MPFPTYILGPCAAESEAQVMETARQLSQLDVPVIFRAGVWKPRTSPDTFQGAGDIALGWLQKVKSIYHLETATEVATAAHVRAALDAGVDYLWLGARTTANPIQVQALAEVIAASPKRPKHVFVKNPVQEDAALWLGDLTRLQEAGISVGAVHRGCNHHPCWAMAHMLRTARPDIPLLLDPSHMTGEAVRIAPLMDYATPLGYDGYMIEVHPTPNQALSDAPQQLTPQQIRGILSHMSQTVTKGDELAWLRAQIDELDDALWSLIDQRMSVSCAIGEYKHAHGITPLQPARFEHILQGRLRWAQSHHLSEKTVDIIMRAIHDESLRHQS